MALLIRIITTTILSLALLSCNFDKHLNTNAGTDGNGNVTVEERIRNKHFTKINAAQGLNVNLSQGETTLVTVTTDANLQDLILTEIKDDVLHIHCKSKIRLANAKTIDVQLKALNAISTSSGSSVKTNATIVTDSLNIKTSSGSLVQLDITANSLHCKSSSGSLLKISGNAKSITAKTSSGSALKAQALKTEQAHVTASSGSSLKVNATTQLTAKASSGASIRYSGSPSLIEKEKSSGASINKQKA